MRNLLQKIEVIAVALTLTLGISISLLLQRYISNHHAENARIELESMASSYTIALQQVLEQKRASLSQFADFHSVLANSPEHHLNQFELEKYLNRSDYLSAVGVWLLDEKGGERENRHYRRGMYAEHRTGPLSEQQEYFITNNVSANSAQSWQRQLFEQSKRAFTEQQIMPVIIPIHTAASSKGATLVGFWISLVDMKRLVVNMVGATIPRWYDMHIYLSSLDDRSHTHVMAYSSSSRTLSAVDPAGLGRDKTVFLPGAISLGDLKLSVAYAQIDRNTEHWIEAFWQAYSVLMLGFVLTFALCAYLISQYKRAQKIEALVKQRTAELNAAKLELEEARREQQIIFDTVPARIWYRSKDNRVVRVNKRTAEMLDKPVSEIEGQAIEKVFPEFGEESVISDQQVIKTGRPILGITRKLVNDNGESSWSRVDKVPYRDESGEVCGVIVLSTDITELKKTAEALRKSDERFQLAVEGANDGIWDWSDLSSDKQYWSPHFFELLGYQVDEVTASVNLFEDFLHPEDRAKTMGVIRAHIEEATPYNVEFRLRKKNGEYNWFRSKGICLAGENGKAGRVVGSISDIQQFKDTAAEKQLMAIQLQQAQKMESVGQLAAGVAHEINTPIQFVGDNIRFLNESFSDVFELIQSLEESLQASNQEVDKGSIVQVFNDKKQEIDFEYLSEEVPQAITQSTDGIGRVSHIVKAMKEFSHPGTKEKKRIDINHAIESTITVSRSEWKYVAELETNFDPDLDDVECLSGEINQTVLNIVVNAAHAIADRKAADPEHRGKIEITTKQAGDQATITISDNGCGMPDDVRKRVFDPFFTTKDVGKGTGQGLYIAYCAIVEKHCGEISVTSQQNTGTTFYITIPVNARNESETSSQVA